MFQIFVDKKVQILNVSNIVPPNIVDTNIVHPNIVDTNIEDTNIVHIFVEVWKFWVYTQM